MPVFEAHVPADRYSDEQKLALADALNQSLVQGLGIPEGDRFIMISEHRKSELYLHSTFMDMNRSRDAMFVTVFVGAHRPLSDKKALASAICQLTSDALGISGDDIFITLVPVPNENFSFGRGSLQLADNEPRW
ncbi:tautomerase family protein [Rhodococcoides fascians]|uniref:tautomerase family protein n=1 Tax=Rhodococcoides fascians TaxID=1828 RepID=UPI00050BFADA|nr:tautomerase family protein [Rhodococcus fascians]